MEQALPLDEALIESLPMDDNSNADVSQMSAEQYLAWVRFESTLLPGVVRVDVNVDPTKQSAYMPVIDSISTCAEEYKPTEEWSNNLCADFSDLRNEISRMSLNLETRERKYKVPPMRDRVNWELFCFGNNEVIVADSGKEPHDSDIDMSCEYDEADSTDGDNEHIAVDQEQEEQSLTEKKRTLLEQLVLIESENVTETQQSVLVKSGEAPAPVLYGVNVSPTISLLLQFDQVLIQLLFKYQLEWLESSRRMNRERALWIYAVMARIEKPLTGDAAASMRHLYRLSCKLRLDLILEYISDSAASRLEQQSAGHMVAKRNLLKLSSENTSGSHPSQCIEQNTAVDREYLLFEYSLACLNTIIVLSGYYFGQGEDFAQLSKS